MDNNELRAAVVTQANNDARGLQEECAYENRQFTLSATDDWDSTAWVECVSELGLTGREVDELWPVYSDALRSAIRAMGGRA